MIMIGEAPWNIEDFRKRLQSMPEDRLIRYGKAARYMADPRNAADKRTVLEVYIIQLRECRAEYRRRHPKENHAATNEGESKIEADATRSD
jgi:hypothetical protein